MGWSSGSQLLATTWRTVRPLIPFLEHVRILTELMVEFAHYDCDTIDELAAHEAEWPEVIEALEQYGREMDRSNYMRGKA